MSALDVLCLISDQFWRVGPITLKEREEKVRRYKEKRGRRRDAKARSDKKTHKRM